MRSSSFPSRSSRLFSSAAALLAVGALGLAAPAAQAKPRITASGTISASGVLVVEGKVRGGASSWRVRLDVRESRTVKGRTVLRWSPRVTSARLGKRTRYRVSTRAGGSSATVRTVALRKGRAKATSRTFTVLRRGGAAPGGPGRVVEPPAAPGTTPPPAGGAAPAAGPGSTLSPGETLAPGAELRSPNGRYRLAMQDTDGNLVLYDGSSALWSTGGYGPGTSLTTRADGNVVGHRDGVARWSTTTTGFDGARLVLQDDGNLVVYRGGQPLWTWGSGYVGDRLEPGQGLAPGSFLRSADGRFRMLMQPEDGNLVLYEGSAALWSTGGSGAGAGVTMQEDGNFVVYQGGVARWHAQTTGFGGARFVLQDDANAVIYHSGHAIWTRGSGYTGDTLNAGGVLQPGAFLRSPSGAWTLLMQPGDGNLVLYATGGAAHWQFGTSGAPGAHAIMQADGNFVVYANGQARNSTRTGAAGSFFRVQDDANLVVYGAGGTPQWSRFGLPAPPTSTPSHPAAAWAAAQVGLTRADSATAALFNDWAPGPYGEWSGDCAKFVFAAWRKAGLDIARGDASQQYRYYRDVGKLRSGAAPVGALVFWPNVAAPYGHIAISDGAGGVYTTLGLDGNNKPISHVHQGYFGTPAGWAMP